MTNIPTLIGFSGLAQSGKTTAAQMLVSDGWDRVSFADPLKAMLKVLTPETDKVATPAVLCGKTVREALQTLGTDWGRSMVGGNIWIEAARARVTELLGDVFEGISRGVVIDDVRFDNEAELIRNMGGLVINIVRDGAVQMDHASEGGIAPGLITCHLTNNGTVTDLHWGLHSLGVVPAPLCFDKVGA